MAQIKGMVYRSGTREPLPGALVKLTKGKESHSGFTDESGAYLMSELEEGKWKLSVIEAYSLSINTSIEIIEPQTDKDIFLPSSKEDLSGKRFFWAMISALGLLVVAYFVLHLIIWPQDQPISQVLNLLAVRIEEPLNSSASFSEDAALVERLADLSKGVIDSVDVNPRIRNEDKALAIQLADGLNAAVESGDKSLVVARFGDLKEFIQTPPQSRFSIWTEDPLRMLEILLWGLAGILVTKIIQVGWYLRKQTYQSRGFWMHLSHLVTTPLLVLVAVLLLSLVTLKFTLAGNNEVTIDLSDPRLMVAFAFIIGTSPWPLWNFIEDTAKKFTGSREDGDD